MKFYILRMSINGIKNIDKEIQLKFYKDGLDGQMKDLKNSHVKAIYGANGAGKTGIIHAINIYKNLILNKDFLTLENANKNLKNLINQQLKKFTMKVDFAILGNDNKLLEVFSHEIELCEDSDKFVISKERFLKLTGFRLNANKYKTIFVVEKGELIEFASKSKEYKDRVMKNTANLLNNSSLISLLFSSNAGLEILKASDMYYAFLFLFCNSLTIVLQDSDDNYVDFYDMAAQVEKLKKVETELSKTMFFDLLHQNKIVKPLADRVKISEFKIYEKKIKRLVKFLQVFKSDLKDIEIKKEEDGYFYNCELILKYNDGRKVNKKYESSGIKKLIRLFSALCDVEQGKIVFIDELDANIHDVLLIKLIEYITTFATGQFVFTTHNIEPMEVLKAYKNSIDFLSEDSKLTSWVKNGNNSPASLYKKGLIEYSPFNIESCDFLGVFKGGDHD